MSDTILKIFLALLFIGTLVLMGWCKKQMDKYDNFRRRNERD